MPYISAESVPLIVRDSGVAQESTGVRSIDVIKSVRLDNRDTDSQSEIRGVALYATLMDLYGGRKIIGIDLNLADEVVNSINRICFKTEIELIRGSSTEPDIVSRVHALLTPDDRVMVLMDSDHSHEHVLRELRTYGPLVSKGQYAIVSDTVVENIPEQTHRPRPWGRGDNPMTAARQYLSETSDFEVDTDIDERLVMSYSPSGYLRKVR